MIDLKQFEKILWVGVSLAVIIYNGHQATVSTCDDMFYCDRSDTIYIGFEGTQASRQIFSTVGFPSNDYHVPEPEEYDKSNEQYYREPISDETYRLWREQDKKKIILLKPVIRPEIKRRMQISRSGWLARVARKRKRGK